MVVPAPEAPPVVVGTYAASSLHGGSSRVVAAKVALLPTLSGCVAAPLHSRCRTALPRRLTVCLVRRHQAAGRTVPTEQQGRVDARGGASQGVAVCCWRGQPVGARPDAPNASPCRLSTRHVARRVLRLSRAQPRLGRARAGEPGN